MTDEPAISVVISTFDRADLLADVLDSLGAQVDPPPFEVVVIDDGSPDHTPAVLHERARALPLVVERQANAGLAAARNRGVELSRAPLVAFLDDDALCGPTWLTDLLPAFDNADVGAVAGRVLLRFESSPPSWLTEEVRSYLSEYDLGLEPLDMAPPEFPRGCHCGVRREIWDRIGGFDPSLGFHGGQLVPNEEKEFFLRVYDAGHRIVYWPAATIEHRIQPERLTRDWFSRRAHGQGVGDSLLADTAAGPAALAREAVRATRAAPILAKSLATGRGSLNARVWWSYCRGRVDGLRLRRATA